jgi:hypothetical protein
VSRPGSLPDCPAWCVEDHGETGTEAGWHSGRLREFAGSDGTAKRGWWGWATQDPGRPIMFELEGPRVARQVEAVDLGIILAATATPEARAALSEALAELGIEVRPS